MPRPAEPRGGDDADDAIAEALELLAALAPGLAAAEADPETSPTERAAIRRIAVRLRELESDE